MKKISRMLLLTVSFVFALFTSCDNNNDQLPGQGSLGPVEVTVGTGPKYFSLTSGEAVTDAAKIKSGDWDIGFQRTRTILTNSGYTAETLGSNGKGGVWYTDKTDFAAVTINDRLGEQDPVLKTYTTDQQGFVYSMSATTEYKLNVINFVGYQEGDGKKDTPFKTFQYNKKQFYISKNGVSGYPTTNMVYIIRHADGVHYSKIQVTDYEYIGTGPSDIFVVTYENFPE